MGMFVLPLGYLASSAPAPISHTSTEEAGTLPTAPT